MQALDEGAQSSTASPAPSENTAVTALCSVSARFPKSVLQWCELITRYAEKHGLPPDLVAALIWQESGGNPTAYSRSGAMGLMQIMPSDGLAAAFRCQNGPCFQNRPKMDELKDPEFNIKYGTRMLAGLLQRNGSLREALKSYGPMNVGYYYADKVLGLFQKYGRE
jgi:soluble lytic murein transglycosylase-like protein